MVINRLIDYWMKGEWPEVFEIAVKLRKGVELTPIEEEWINELSRATGWSREDIVEDLKHLVDDPIERVGRYRSLFEKYFNEASKMKGKGDTLQAAEKIWGAITALIKLYAALKGVVVIHWSRKKLDIFITNNVETRHKRLFRDLLDRGRVMHEYFYEAILDPETFEERWNELIELVKKAEKIVFAHM